MPSDRRERRCRSMAGGKPKRLRVHDQPNHKAALHAASNGVDQMMGQKQELPCMDCADGYCTMNCGPSRIAPDVRPPRAARCSYCNGTGWIAIRSHDLAYAFPGPVPDDAR